MSILTWLLGTGSKPSKPTMAYEVRMATSEEFADWLYQVLPDAGRAYVGNADATCRLKFHERWLKTFLQHQGLIHLKILRCIINEEPGLDGSWFVYFFQAPVTCSLGLSMDPLGQIFRRPRVMSYEDEQDMMYMNQHMNMLIPSYFGRLH